VLGRQIGEQLGQVTSQRVLPADGEAPRVEVSFESHGRLLDCDVDFRGTYVATAQSDGSLLGEGQGLDMAKDGSMIRWVGQGSGHFTGGGRVAWRGAIQYCGGTGALASLNGCCALFEYDVDESGKAEARLYEWT
jgi:hypothetical protein